MTPPPLRRGGLHQKHGVVSVLDGAEQNLTQKAEADFYADPARDQKRLQPPLGRSEMKAFPHQRYLYDINVALTFTMMRLIKWRRPVSTWRAGGGKRLCCNIV